MLWTQRSDVEEGILIEKEVGGSTLMSHVAKFEFLGFKGNNSISLEWDESIETSYIPDSR